MKTLFSFEENFNPFVVRQWFEDYHLITGIPVILFYLISLPLLKNYMKDRPALNLKPFLITWNLFLSIFSFLGAYRCIPEFIRVWKKYGAIGTVCETHYYQTKPEAFWTCAFVVSKIPELMDTYFLILRKRKVIFLHWYHHCTVIAYGWFFYHNWYAGTAWYGVMNYSVHFIMYLYYAIMATKMVRFPKFVSISITSAQISQMIFGICVQGVLWMKRNDPKCATSHVYVYAGVTMYGSYFILFMNYFIQAYMKPKSKKE